MKVRERMRAKMYRLPSLPATWLRSVTVTQAREPRDLASDTRYALIKAAAEKVQRERAAAARRVRRGYDLEEDEDLDELTDIVWSSLA